MRVSRKFIIRFFAALMIGFSTSAFALPMLDQEFNPANKNVSAAIGIAGAVPTQNLDAGQVFTVGITGLLTRVDLMVGRVNSSTTGAPLLFDIRTTTAGVPSVPDVGGNILGSLALAPVLFPNDVLTSVFTSVDLTGLGINVVAGDELAIVLRSLGDNPAFTWTGSNVDNFGGGTPYRRVFTNVWEVPTFVNDLAFRTFVDPSGVVSAPSTVVLMGLGLAGLGFARRRQGR